MSQDAQRLMARPAEQQSTIRLLAQPAAQSSASSIPYVPSTWPQVPAPASTPTTQPETRRSLGRVRFPVRVLSLQILSLVLAGVLIFALIHFNAYGGLGWEWYFVIAYGGVQIILVLCYFVLPRWILRRHQAIDLTRWRRPTRQDLRWVIAGLGAMVAFWFAYWAIIPWIGWEWALPEQPPEGSHVVAFATWWHLLIFALSAILIAPVIEETFFRGFMLGGLNRVWWLVPSLLLSAALFSAVHFNLYMLIPFTIFGLLLGALYLRTKHLTAPALAHACWNLGVTVILIMEYGIG